MLMTIAALAIAASPTPLAVVKAADAEVNKVLASAEPTAEKLAQKADQFVDFGELAKRAMGEGWAKLTKAQQEDFSATMKGLLRANYAQKAIKDGRGDAKVEYGAEAITGNEATVKTTLMMKQDKFPVTYTLYRVDAKSPWRVYDVVTDEVSLVQTYSDQFRSGMAKKGFDGLLASLKSRRDQLEKDSNAGLKDGGVPAVR